MRSLQHNEDVLAKARKRPFDCCTSMSVLNVIDTKEARIKHIRLCFDALKAKGSAFFKVWAGNRSGIAAKSEGRFQSNLDAAHYISEVEEVFGKEAVQLVDETTIRAIKEL
jgi:hypothetical protein